MKDLKKKITSNELYFHLIQDALDKAKKTKDALHEELEEGIKELEKMKEFLEFAGLESIYKKWETNDQLPFEEYEPLDFEEMYEEEKLVCITPQLKKAN